MTWESGYKGEREVCRAVKHWAKATELIGSTLGVRGLCSGLWLSGLGACRVLGVSGFGFQMLRQSGRNASKPKAKDTAGIGAVPVARGPLLESRPNRS